MDPYIGYLCFVCCKSTSIWCSRCQKAWYCTPEHLQNDWPRHRRECVAIASALSNTLAVPRPVQPPALAILFSPQEDGPRLITMAFQPPQSSAPGACPSPIIQEYLPDLQLDNVVLTQGPHGELLQYPLQLWYCPGASAVDTPTNDAIYCFTSGRASTPWHGPVIVLKYDGQDRKGYCDAGNDEFRVLAYFLAHK